MVDWCTCKRSRKWPSGDFTCLNAVSDIKVEYVCAKCWKPSQPVWRGGIKRCKRCGDLHDSPWEQWCRGCTVAVGEEYIGWNEARVLERILRTQMGLFGQKKTLEMGLRATI